MAAAAVAAAAAATAPPPPPPRPPTSLVSKVASAISFALEANGSSMFKLTNVRHMLGPGGIWIQAQAVNPGVKKKNVNTPRVG